MKKTKETEILYVSFFCLSHGIIEIPKPTAWDKFIGYKGYFELPTIINRASRVQQKYVHESIEEAIKQAKIIKKNRVYQMEKEIQKIKAIEF